MSDYIQGPPLLDFFGVSVKANDLINRVEELQLLAKRISRYEDPIKQFRVLSYLKPSNWSKGCGWNQCMYFLLSYGYSTTLYLYIQYFFFYFYYYSRDGNPKLVFGGLLCLTLWMLLVDDARLLLGIHYHGFGNWENIRLDERLGLTKKIAPVELQHHETFLPRAPNLKERANALLEMVGNRFPLPKFAHPFILDS